MSIELGDVTKVTTDININDFIKKQIDNKNFYYNNGINCTFPSCGNCVLFEFFNIKGCISCYDAILEYMKENCPEEIL